MVTIPFKSPPKVWSFFHSNCLQKLRQMLACSNHARSLAFSFEILCRVAEAEYLVLHLRNKNWCWEQCFLYGKNWETLEKHAPAKNVFKKVLPRVIETDARDSSRHEESSYYYSILRALVRYRYGCNWFDLWSLQMKLHCAETFSVNQWQTSLPILET